MADGFEAWVVVLEHGCIIKPSGPTVLKGRLGKLHPRPTMLNENERAIYGVAVLWAVKLTSPKGNVIKKLYVFSCPIIGQ